jgi:hypothetical protein
MMELAMEVRFPISKTYKVFKSLHQLEETPQPRSTLPPKSSSLDPIKVEQSSVNRTPQRKVLLNIST